MMVPGFDLDGIGWKNPDVNKLLEVLGKQFDQMDQEMKDLKKENRKVVAENDQLRSKIDELTKTIEKLKNKRGRSKKARSYNTGKFKGYLRRAIQSKALIFGLGPQNRSNPPQFCAPPG